MIRRTATWLLVIALSLSIGLQWAVLQSAAWVGMVVTYSLTKSVPVALWMTFGGKHPCKLCKIVERGSQTDPQKQHRAPAWKRMHLAMYEAEVFTFHWSKEMPVDTEVSQCRERAIEPPSPPPKVA